MKASDIEILDALNEAYPCRETQLSALYSTLGNKEYPSPTAVCLTGVSGTGKSAITRAFLEAFEISFVWVDCLESFTPALLFDRILEGMRTLTDFPEPSLRRSEDTNQFIVELRTILAQVTSKVCLVCLPQHVCPNR
jgi:Cdc6-like AAA superfamily ATPase